MVGLEPVRLDVINESEKHAGHRSSPGTGESHFRVLVVSEKFAGQSRVAATGWSINSSPANWRAAFTPSRWQPTRPGEKF